MSFLSSIKLGQTVLAEPQVYLGERGLDKTYQWNFKPEEKCSHCGSPSRIAFVMREEVDEKNPDSSVPYIYEMHENTWGHGKGEYWPHDVTATAVYFCTKCAEATALSNQG